MVAIPLALSNNQGLALAELLFRNNLAALTERMIESDRGAAMDALKELQSALTEAGFTPR